MCMLLSQPSLLHLGGFPADHVLLCQDIIWTDGIGQKPHMYLVMSCELLCYASAYILGSGVVHGLGSGVSISVPALRTISLPVYVCP